MDTTSASTLRALKSGTVVANRFEVHELLDTLGGLSVYTARDQRSKKLVALWHFPPGSLKADVNAAMRAGVKNAVALRGDDVVTTFGPSTDTTGSMYIATDAFGARSLEHDVQARELAGPLEIQDAFDLLRPAFSALTSSAGIVHGALAPSLVRTDAGAARGKLAGFGMSAALFALGAVPAAYIAPELHRGEPATPRSDVYALGVMLYVLCTGVLPDGARTASEVNSALPVTFDVILENCLADAPADRFEDVAKLRASLGSLVAPTSVVPASSAAVDEGFDIPVDVDVDMGAPVEQAPPVQSAPVVQVPPVKAPAPKPAPRPAPAMAAPPPPPPPPPPPEPAIPRASVPTPALNEVQLRDLIRAEAQDDSPRWMYVINNLDHGPFTALEIMQAVKEHKVTEDDVVFNMDSGERRKLFEWPQFQDLGAQARETRKRKKRDKEAEGAIAQERTSTRAKALVGGTLIVVIGGLVALYFTTLSPSARQARREAELNAKLASGALRTTGSSVEITDEPPPPTSTTNSGPRRPRPSGSVSFTSYEEAMRAPVDMDINSGMGARLSGSDIQAPLNAALDRFARCATSDISRGNDTHQVKIRVAVNGNGQPIGANILTGSPQFKSCMLGIIKGLKWRAYGGQRMGFGWGFSVDE